MRDSPKLIWVKGEMNMMEGVDFLRKAFDDKGFVRVRVRVKSGKKTKVRNVRLSSPDAVFVGKVKEELALMGIKALMYPIGKSFCIDIEGKMKVSMFHDLVGFSDEGKKQQLVAALMPLSLEMVEGDVNST